MVYLTVNNKEVIDANFGSSEYRKILTIEALLCSDDVMDMCLICGETNDVTTSKSIEWIECERCERWIHKACSNIQT